MHASLYGQIFGLMAWRERNLSGIIKKISSFVFWR